jgi:hypothetical protein
VARKKTVVPVRRTNAIPAALEEELQRLAQEILLERSAEARKAAALETANKLLARIGDLLAIAHSGAPARATLAMAPTVIKNPCINCGLEGTFRPKPDKFNPKPGWLCPAHAGAYRRDNAEAQTAGALLSTLKNAAPIDDSSLPE